MSSAVLSFTGSYIQSEWIGSHSNTPWRPMQAPRNTGFITISRQSGSGGTSFARILARLLNGGAPVGASWSVYEKNLPARLLEANHLPTYYARFLLEDKTPQPHAFIGEMIGLHPNIWDLVEKNNRAMRGIARQGNVILVGRGANLATAEVPGGVHVRLVAPAEHRARYFSQIYGVSEEKAYALNAKRDAARRRYVSTTFNGANIDDARAYDLVLNTAHISLAEAASLVVELLHTRKPA